MGGTEDFVAVSCGFLSRVGLFSDQRKKKTKPVCVSDHSEKRT
jgi:hypothetical protein